MNGYGNEILWFSLAKILYIVDRVDVNKLLVKLNVCGIILW